jgi:DNA (cytosine-5)-methyltransferase 1
MGLHRAGFVVTGVDCKPQPRYPFRFVQADALTVDLAGYDLIWASPPCQAYSVANNIHARTDHLDLVASVRARLLASGTPYIIENVPGSPLREPVTLCGSMFGLSVKRHRVFECSYLVLTPECVPGHPGEWVCIFGYTVLERSPQIGRTAKDGPRFRRRHLQTDIGRAAMGIPWMTRDELSQAIPPAYSEFLARFAPVRGSGNQPRSADGQPSRTKTLLVSQKQDGR